jgi:hypothetical protein
MAAWPGNHCGTVATTPPQQLAVTIITIEEVLGGWYTQVRRARDDQQLARAYEALQQTVEFTRGIQLLPFDLPGIRRIANCVRTIVALGRMISASLRLSSNSRGSW